MTTENLDQLVNDYRRSLGNVEGFLTDREWPLDPLIQLSELVNRLSAHVVELRAFFPKDHRFSLLNARCEMIQQTIANAADEAARSERFAGGMSVH